MKPIGPAVLVLLATLACCQADWLPFRTNRDGICHEVRILYQTSDGEIPKKDKLDNPDALAAAAKDGVRKCDNALGGGWAYIRTVNFEHTNEWEHVCRICDPSLADAALMWFGNAPSCYGSCPTGWRTLSKGVTATYLIDATWDGRDANSSPDFGGRCSIFSGGKVLCALQGRPASAGCSYTWRGTAPDCRDACEPGETLVAKDWYGGGARCLSGTYNKMLCERCQQEILDLNDCTKPTWFGTAPACSGECYVGDRVMARAQSSSDVPSDQDPGGFGKKCWNGWKVRCHQCRVLGRSLLGSSNKRPTCSAPKAGRAWAGTSAVVLKAVKTYAACCRECQDVSECRRFHVGPAGCALFVGAKADLRVVPASYGRAGGGGWQAGSVQAGP